jgi:hypothetical protein
MGLHIKDRALLEQLQSYFKVGNISNHGSDMIHFRVESIKDLTKLINHFDSYPLITKKQAEFILFKKAYLIMLNKEHLTRDGLEKIIAIKSSLNKGLSNTLSLAFPNIAAIEKLSAIDIKISSPQWCFGKWDFSFVPKTIKLRGHLKASDTKPYMKIYEWLN